MGNINLTKKFNFYSSRDIERKWNIWNIIFMVPCVFILIRSNKMQKMQVFITANSLYMFRLSNDPIIRSTSNCNYCFWYKSYHVSGQQPSASVALLGQTSLP